MLSAEARRVLELMAIGMSIAEVAARLEMPIASVRQHLADAIDALGAGSRLDAILKAARRGLIDLPR